MSFSISNVQLDRSDSSLKESLAEESNSVSDIRFDVTVSGLVATAASFFLAEGGFYPTLELLGFSFCLSVLS